MNKPATISKPQKSAKTDLDLVDRIIMMLCEMRPEWRRDPKALQEAEAAVRAELGGQRHYVRAPQQPDVAREILLRFNGRNVSEVARRLGIGRATVYRVIRQAGRAPR
jgi:Mor family transcriptional regulator